MLSPLFNVSQMLVLIINIFIDLFKSPNDKSSDSTQIEIKYDALLCSWDSCATEQPKCVCNEIITATIWSWSWPAMLKLLSLQTGWMEQGQSVGQIRLHMRIRSHMPNLTCRVILSMPWSFPGVHKLGIWEQQLAATAPLPPNFWTRTEWHGFMSWTWARDWTTPP